AVGELTRKPILVFVLPVAIVLICGFFLWDWSPTWLDPRINLALGLIDPAGYRWLVETYLKVDRGVAFYNTQPIPLDGWFVASRLAFFGMGLAAVAVARRHFVTRLRGARVRDWRAAIAEPEPSPLTRSTPLV